VIRTIVVAVDGSPSSEAAFDRACEIAGAFQAKLIVLTVAPVQTYFPPGKGPADVSDHEVATYRRIAARAAEKARSHGIAVVEAVNLDGFVVDSILGYVERSPPDLLVVGARGLSGARRMFLGGVSTSIVGHVACPVLIVPEPVEPAGAAGSPPAPAP